jgi:outer membrane protein assembly factor BamA
MRQFPRGAAGRGRFRASAPLSCLLGLLLWSAGSWAAPPVVEIRFEGNRTTREPVMRQELLLEEGDPADPEVIEASRQSLMNMGLFKDVAAETETVDDGVVVTYRLTEKYFYFLLPKLNRSADGDIRYGGDLRLDNVLGLNQQLRVRYEIEEPDSGAEQGSVRLGLDYRVPRVPGTRFGAGLDLGIRQTERSPSDGELSDRYEEEARHVGMSLSRWLDRRGPTRGWRLDLGTRWESRRYEALDVDAALPESGDDVSWRAGVIFTDVADFGVRLDGVEYGGVATVGTTGLGAMHNHERVDLFYRRYATLGGDLPSSLHYQLRAGWTSETPFDDDAYTIGGGSSLRGYARDYRVGDVRLLANVEYLRPLFGNPAVRGLVFTDIGGVWPRGDIDLGDVHVGAGVGLRINLRWFVRTDLRADAAYGNEARAYVGTSHTF